MRYSISPCVRTRNLSILVVALAVLITLSSVSAITVTPTESMTVKVKFDKPNGTTESFTGTGTVEFSSTEGEDVSDLTVIFYEVSPKIENVDVTVDKTAFNVFEGQTESVTVTFTVPATTEEGTYTGILRLTGMGISATEIKKTKLVVEHPPATFNVTWSEDIGNMKAGSEVSRTVRVAEVMGYASASSVEIKLNESGPAELEYSGAIGDTLPFEIKNFQVKVKVPERNLVPGTYEISASANSPDETDMQAYNATYVIPIPMMTLDSSSLDFGKVTFEPGKDSSEKILVIRETGGYTPIEGISIKLGTGEEGWISYSEGDYIPPGGSKEYTFKLFLPTDATIGKKNWLFSLETAHAGLRSLSSWVTVYFPGIDEALTYMRGVSAVENYTASQMLIDNTVLLLDNSKSLGDTRKIALVMSIYSSARSFLDSMSESVKSKAGGEFYKAGDAVIRAKNSLNKMEVGNENLMDDNLKKYSSKCVESASGIWNYAVADTISLMEEKAGEGQGYNYKSAALYYKQMGQIYELLGNQEKKEASVNKQKEMEAEYIQTLMAADRSKSRAIEKEEETKKSMFRISDAYFILNPFSYERVMDLYDSSISEYTEAESLYRRAGETNDAESLVNTIEKMENGRNSVNASFTLYGIVLTLLFILFLARVGIGLQRFKTDDMDTKLGEIVGTGEN